MAVISSLTNARVKRIRALSNRKERDQTGQFFVEGIRGVTEAIQTGALIDILVVAPELLTSQAGRAIVERQQRRRTPLLEVTADVFESISLRNGYQGLGAVVRQRWEPLAHVRLASELCWVALDAVQYPGNLGTILRTSDAVGGAGIILLGRTTDPYDPLAARASLGAIFSQRLVRTNFAEFAAWKQQHRYMVVGTSAAAATDYREAAYQPPLVLLMGSERRGLSPEQQALCDTMVRIPMVGRSNSLNLAVATGVMLYQIFHQQRSLAHP